MRAEHWMSSCSWTQNMRPLPKRCLTEQGSPSKFFWHVCRVRRRSCCPYSALINSLEYSAKKMKDTLLSQRTFEFIVPISLHYQCSQKANTMGAEGEHDITARWLKHSHGSGRARCKVPFLETYKTSEVSGTTSRFIQLSPLGMWLLQ